MAVLKRVHAVFHCVLFGAVSDVLFPGTSAARGDNMSDIVPHNTRNDLNKPESCNGTTAKSYAV